MNSRDEVADGRYASEEEIGRIRGLRKAARHLRGQVDRTICSKDCAVCLANEANARWCECEARKLERGAKRG